MAAKLNELKALLYALFIYLGIKTGIVEILFYLMIIDSILGILKALRLGNKFSFVILGYGMISKLTILIVPMIVALVGKGLQMDFTYFVIATINILIVNEGISCITNILTIRTKKQIENTDFMTKFIELIRGYFISIMNGLFNAIDKENTKIK